MPAGVVHTPCYDADIMQSGFVTREDYLEASQRVVTGLNWPVGVVRLVGDALYFPIGSETRQRTARPTLWYTFTQLHKKSPRQVAVFARQWGSLGVCAHGERVGAAPCRCTEPRLEEWPETAFVETVEHWQMWSYRLDALTRLARDIHADRALDDTLLREATAWGPWPHFARSIPAVHTTKRRTYLRALLDALLRTADIRRRVALVSGRLAITDTVHDAFSAVCLQVVMECVRVRSLAQCVACQHGFRAARISDRYCADCRSLNRPGIDAAQRHRDKLRLEGLTARGTPRKR